MAKLDKTINVRVDEETYKEIKALAEGEGLSLSAWVRSLVEGEVTRNSESQQGLGEPAVPVGFEFVSFDADGYTVNFWREGLQKVRRIPVDECPAGPALDAAVAEALGWKRSDKRPVDREDWLSYPDEWFERPDGAVENVTNVPKFSRAIAAAWRLVEEVQSEGGQTCLRFQNLMSQDAVSQFERVFLWNLSREDAALFICRAFLKANGVEEIEAGE